MIFFFIYLMSHQCTFKNRVRTININIKSINIYDDKLKWNKILNDCTCKRKWSMCTFGPMLENMNNWRCNLQVYDFLQNKQKRWTSRITTCVCRNQIMVKGKIRSKHDLDYLHGVQHNTLHLTAPNQ